MGWMLFWIGLMTAFILHGLLTEPARMLWYGIVGAVIWFASLYGVHALMVHLDEAHRQSLIAYGSIAPSDPESDPIPPFLDAFWYGRTMTERRIVVVVSVWASLLIGRNIIAGLFTGRQLGHLGRTV